MLEMILSPRKSERRTWELFFVGFFYASISVLLVSWLFSKDPVLSKYSGILIVTFAVMFSIPFVYSTIRREEYKDLEIDNSFRLLKEHSKAIFSFLFLFIGFILAFSAWYIILGSTENYKAQIETYCAINSPSNYNLCVSEYVDGGKTTGNVAGFGSFLSILSNNLYVLLFTFIFSIIIGAGGIFILAWNASVIAAAMVIFSKSEIINLPLSLARYMIHGLPEIAAYFIGTLAGGIIGISIIKKEFKTDKFWNIVYDSILLIITAAVILLLAALMEVFITPKLF